MTWNQSLHKFHENKLGVNSWEKWVNTFWAHTLWLVDNKYKEKQRELNKMSHLLLWPVHFGFWSLSQM